MARTWANSVSEASEHRINVAGITGTALPDLPVTPFIFGAGLGLILGCLWLSHALRYLFIEISDFGFRQIPGLPGVA